VQATVKTLLTDSGSTLEFIEAVTFLVSTKKFQPIKDNELVKCIMKFFFMASESYKCYNKRNQMQKS